MRRASGDDENIDAMAVVRKFLLVTLFGIPATIVKEKERKEIYRLHLQFPLYKTIMAIVTRSWLVTLLSFLVLGTYSSDFLRLIRIDNVWITEASGKPQRNR